MLFLYRPRETWMPYSLPRQRTDQAAYNRSLQSQFRATKRVPSPAPAAPELPSPEQQLEGLAALRESGALTEAEYEAAAARLKDG